MSPLPVTYTRDQVAEALQIKPRTVSDLVAAGKVRPMRLSDSGNSPMRFTDADVKDLEKALRSTNPVAAAQTTRRSRRAS